MHKNRRPLSNGHSLIALSPFIDQHGVLRVRGRLDKGQKFRQGDGDHHPVIMPKNHYVNRLLMRKFHHQVLHQGRLLTEGALRSGGFWVVGAKNFIRSEIKSRVICRKLRGSFGWQKMADLPEDRMQPAPPFSYVGVDTFGPWLTTQGRTRGGTVNQKILALMFTCLVSRAVHLEAIEELSTASFINALRRFIALRGPDIQFRSDSGTSFTGSVHELNIPSDLVEDPISKRYLEENKVTWAFNPPHASHFGRAWERMIGASRKILDSLLLNHKGPLTHEVLTTFLMDVSAILNARPFVEVSTDPDAPQVLSPDMLIHQNTVHTSQLDIPVFGTKDALRSSWKQVQYLADQFWQRWRIEYMQSLQIRQKWLSEGRQFQKGDVVLM
ncbi:uncharacterized protein LOC125647403 [Ostrea edulis]|uniref:uncharacterized protein LOC125647403 n=1 Tax=Ostrea edulis TaxID=37623 RepID=UPI0024AFAAD5|nr:uncharacterized protein LOC125647403 [Ostrea edulis]